MHTQSLKRRHLRLEWLEQRQMLHGGVYPEVTLQTNLGDITMELYTDDAPGTVQNFLNYMSDGDYVNAIFHRLAILGDGTPFVLQGGGFTSDPADLCTSPCGLEDVDPDQFAEVPTDAPIVNEFGRSNLRSTVAMAKLGGNPDSATNQFFVNLSNNSANLDNQNGGFTVFAGVTDMTLVDRIATFQTVDLSSIFPPTSPLTAISDAPVDMDDDTDVIQLVRIESISGKGLLHGTLFLDGDADGNMDAGEGGLAGRTVYLDDNDNGVLDNGETSTETSDRGEYHFLVDPGDYVVRQVVAADYSAAGNPTRLAATARLGEDTDGLDFGSRYVGLSWHNDILPTDVNGINGTTPIDALLIINEFDERDFSDPDEGTLPPQVEPLNPPRFLDVEVNNIVEPLDALLVINELPTTAPAAALSSSVDFNPQSPVDILPPRAMPPVQFSTLENDLGTLPSQHVDAAAHQTRLIVETSPADYRTSRVQLDPRASRRLSVPRAATGNQPLVAPAVDQALVEILGEL